MNTNSRELQSATVKIFLPHGDPKRLRTGEISNWSGKAVAGPRTELEQILSREESRNAGVYILSGTDPNAGSPAAYIGEAESIKYRIKQHLERDFWTQLVFFVSKDETLTKAHIRFLEGRMISMAKDANRANLMNSQATSSKLPESDMADMEIFLGKVEQLLPALGVDVLVPLAANAENFAVNQLLFCGVNNVVASARLTPTGILVLKGSKAASALRPSASKYPWITNARAQLLNSGILIQESDALVFMKDHEFPSPSAAAAMIHGGTANGRTAWKTLEGRTLKELEGG